MKKYIIIGIASFVIELAATMYIATVADRDFMMIFWACIGPFLGLPFVGYMVESKNWNERIKMAMASSIGYTLGSLLIYLLKV
jgi:hypothetical protein